VSLVTCALRAETRSVSVAIDAAVAVSSRLSTARLIPMLPAATTKPTRTPERMLACISPPLTFIGSSSSPRSSLSKSWTICAAATASRYFGRAQDLSRLRWRICGVRPRLRHQSGARAPGVSLCRSHLRRPTATRRALSPSRHAGRSAVQGHGRQRPSGLDPATDPPSTPCG
jgi:hypothetical protein